MKAILQLHSIASQMTQSHMMRVTAYASGDAWRGMSSDCWHCGERGHWRRHCPYLQAEQGCSSLEERAGGASGSGHRGRSASEGFRVEDGEGEGCAGDNGGDGGSWQGRPLSRDGKEGLLVQSRGGRWVGDDVAAWEEEDEEEEIEEGGVLGRAEGATEEEELDVGLEPYEDAQRLERQTALMDHQQGQDQSRTATAALTAGGFGEQLVRISICRRPS